MAVDLRQLGDDSMTNVALLGLGRMGSRLAGTLLRHGFDTTVWNRTAGPADRLIEAGARVETAAARAARHADAVVLSLSDGGAVRDVLFGGDEPVADQLRPDAIVIDTSTTGPRLARSIAAELDRRGLCFVEAPLLGSPAAAARGTLTTLTGGDPEVVELVLPVIESWTAPGRIVHLGDPGAAAAAKLIVNASVGVAAEGIGEALRLGQDLGLDRSRLIEALRGGPLGSLIGAKEQMLLQEDTGDADLTVDLFLHDLSLALYESSSALPAAEAAYLQARLATSAGRGGHDFIEIALRRATNADQRRDAEDLLRQPEGQLRT